jgi:hypothetical protein
MVHWADGPPDEERVPRVVFLTDGDHGRIGIKSKGRCWYCGRDFSLLKRTLDHVVPRSKGGSNDPKNLVFACEPCNSDKASMRLEVYRWHLEYERGVKPVVFYGETLNAQVSSPAKVMPSPMRVISSIDEAISFASREG